MTEGCPFDIKPYLQSDIINRPNIVNLNYTNQEFQSLKIRLVEYIRNNFANDFNDFIESSLAIMLIENWAFIADTLSFKMDQISNELFIDTVTEIENAFRLSKLVGFVPQPPLPSKSFWTATINNPLLVDIEIPTPFDIDVQTPGKAITIELFPADSDNNPIYEQNIIIPAGSVVNGSIVGLEGKTHVQTIQGTGIAGQTIELGFFPAIYDSIRVDVDGVRWVEVPYFTDSQFRREFRVEFDSTYTGYVIFGNNRAGLLPSKGSNISITYRSGGGIAGNIVSGFVSTQTIVNAAGLTFSVPINLRNYTKGESGYDGDTLEDIRNKLPAWIRTQDRAVSGLDYKTLADQFSTPSNGQIGKSIAVLRNYGCAGNIIDIYVLARITDTALEEASNELKVALREYFENVKMLTDFICIRDGSIITTDIGIDVTLDKFYRKFEDENREKIKRRTNLFFSLNNWEFGDSLRDVDLIKNLSDIKEISNFDVTFVTNETDNGGQTVTAKYNEIIRPDVIDVQFIYE